MINVKFPENKIPLAECPYNTLLLVKECREEDFVGCIVMRICNFNGVVIVVRKNNKTSLGTTGVSNDTLFEVLPRGTQITFDVLWKTVNDVLR